MQFPRETVEYLPLVVLLDGATHAYTVSVVAAGNRPGAFTDGPYLISGLTAGHYHAWVKVADSPEIPVTGPISFWIT